MILGIFKKLFLFLAFFLFLSIPYKGKPLFIPMHQAFLPVSKTVMKELGKVSQAAWDQLREIPDWVYSSFFDNEGDELKASEREALSKVIEGN